jgi:hypothetical protein
MNIRVSIGSLSLESFALTRRQGLLVRDAVESELSRLLAEGGMSPELTRGISLPSVPAEAISWGSGDPPAALGRRIAAAVYGGIGR